MEVLIIGVLTITLVLLTYTIGNDKGYENGYKAGLKHGNKEMEDAIKEYFERNRSPIEPVICDKSRKRMKSRE